MTRRPNLNDIIAAGEGTFPDDVDPVELQQATDVVRETGPAMVRALYGALADEARRESVLGDLIIVAGIVDVTGEEALAAARRLGRVLKVDRRDFEGDERELLGSLHAAKAEYADVVILRPGRAVGEATLTEGQRKKARKEVVKHLLPRKRKEQRCPDDDFADKKVSHDDALAVFEAFENVDLLRRLLGEADLSDGQRDVLGHRLDGVPYSEIAQRLGRPVNSCMAQASQARRKMRAAAERLGLL